MVQLLMSSKMKRGISVEKTIMIGRQNLHLSVKQLGESLDSFGYNGSEARAKVEKYDAFAEGFFEMLGAETVDSLDASNYENATIISDLNIPISSEHKNSYDLVLDSGTLEHVFNLPVALRNCMEMTKVGGHYIGIYPANNMFGHGFYQFSSELFYRALCAENGFEVLDVILFTDLPDTRFYSVPDTSEAHQRITFSNRRPVLMYIVAKRIRETEIFKDPPLQMDYSQLKWQGKRQERKTPAGNKTVKSTIPSYFKNLAKAILNKKPKDDHYSFRKPYFSEYKLK